MRQWTYQAEGDAQCANGHTRPRARLRVRQQPRTLYTDQRTYLSLYAGPGQGAKTMASRGASTIPRELPKARTYCVKNHPRGGAIGTHKL